MTDEEARLHVSGGLFSEASVKLSASEVDVVAQPDRIELVLGAHVRFFGGRVGDRHALAVGALQFTDLLFDLSQTAVVRREVLAGLFLCPGRSSDRCRSTRRRTSR